MNIKIICVGKLKEKFYREAAAEYCKRLSRYCKLEVTELPDEKTPDNSSTKEELLIIEKEGLGILKQIKVEMFVVALAIKGKNLSSEELADFINEQGINGNSNITFVIGGSLGLSSKVLERADYALSFSSMTFPHQLMRVILLEQIYRSYRIIGGEPYHK